MKRCTTSPCPYKEPFCPTCGFYQEVTFLCPKCKTAIKPEAINGLYYSCGSCGFLDDSTFDMIMSVSDVPNKIGDEKK